MKLLVDENELTGIANAIREKTGKSASMEFPTEFVSEIESIPEKDEWIRPTDWPDLDSLDYSSFDGYYLTYKLDEVEAEYQYITLCATTTDNGEWVLERGHISGNAFVSEYAVEVAHRSQYSEHLNASNGNVQLWRVTAKTGYLTSGGVFNAREAENGNVEIGMQPCVEQYSCGENLTQSNINTPSVNITGYARLGHSTYYLQHDRIIGETAFTSFGNFWREAVSLELVDFQNANFPNLTSIGQVFNYGKCSKIDFSKASIENVTNLQLAFANMHGCKYLDITGYGDNITTFNRLCEGSYSVVDFYPCKINASFPINSWRRLSKESLTRIITALQQTETTLTITLPTSTKATLTSEQIATISQKGWTIA